MFREVDIFEIYNFPIKGKPIYTTTFINNRGIYRVYSAKTSGDGSIGNINSYGKNIECLTITTNGYAGYVFHRERHKFNINSDCCIIIIKSSMLNKIDYKYLKIEIGNALYAMSLGWDNKLTNEKW